MLFSLTLLATVAGIVPPIAPTVDAASAELRGGSLAVQVETSGPVASTDVRTKVLAHSFVVYLGGARVRPDRIHLGTETQAVVAYSRLTYAKLEVPLHAGLGCAGPVSVTTGPDWVRAEVGCAPRPNGTDQSPAESGAASGARATLAPPPPKPKTETKVETKSETKIETAPLAAPLLVVRPQAPKEVLLRVSPLSPAVPAAVAPAATSPTTAPDSGGHSGLIACLLLLLAAGAFGLWKRRNVPLDRRIRILETASLGPKRALILAEVNGVTMVIGASEAGIALLTAPKPAVNDGAIPSNETAADEPDSPFGDAASARSLAQSGALHNLFPTSSSPASPNAAETSEQAEDALFASMLAETMEDQELRHRLSTGFSGKTS